MIVTPHQTRKLKICDSKLFSVYQKNILCGKDHFRGHIICDDETSGKNYRSHFQKKFVKMNCSCDWTDAHWIGSKYLWLQKIGMDDSKSDIQILEL